MRLFGAEVREEDYEKTKAIAELLFGLSPIGSEAKEVRKYCVMAASMVIRQVRQHYGMEPIESL